MNRMCNEIEQHNHNRSRETENDYFPQEALEKLIQESSISIQSGKNEIKLETCENIPNETNENKAKMKSNWSSIENNSHKKEDNNVISIDSISMRNQLEKDGRKINEAKHDSKASSKESIVEYIKNNFNKENGNIETIIENHSTLNEYDNDSKNSCMKQNSQPIINNANNTTYSEKEDTSEMINNEKYSPHKLKKLVSNSAFKDYSNPQTNSNKNIFDVNTGSFDSESNCIFNSENNGMNAKMFSST